MSTPCSSPQSKDALPFSTSNSQQASSFFQHAVCAWLLGVTHAGSDNLTDWLAQYNTWAAFCLPIWLLRAVANIHLQSDLFTTKRLVAHTVVRVSRCCCGEVQQCTGIWADVPRIYAAVTQSPYNSCPYNQVRLYVQLMSLLLVMRSMCSMGVPACQNMPASS